MSTGIGEGRDEPAGTETGPADRLAALERENAELRRLLVAAGGGRTTPERGAAPGRRPRATAAAVLIALGAVLAPVGVAAAWAERTLTDTDRYVATVGPLASDPVVKSAVAGRLTAAVMSRIDVAEILGTVVSGLEEQGVSPRAVVALGALEAPLTSGVESFVRRAADGVVESATFEDAWVQANRVAHEQLVSTMEGQGGELLQIGRDGQLTVQLSGMVDLLKDRLVERGLDVAATIPEVGATFTVLQTSQLVQVQNRYAQLVALGAWLPWIVLGLLASGVLVASHRLRALVVAGLALAAGMVVLGMVLAVARGLYLDALDDVVLRLDAAEVLYDQLVSFLRLTLRTVGVLGLAVALAAALGGGSASARTLRAGIARAFARLRTFGERRGVSSGPVGDWLGRYGRAVRVAVVALAALVLLLVATPTPALVVGTAVVAGAVVAVLELLSRPPAPAGVQGPEGEAVSPRPSP